MKIQVNYFGTWRDNKIISGGVPIVLDGMYSIKDRINNMNPELRKIAKPGRYRFHVILTDSHGNILKDAFGNDLEVTQELHPTSYPDGYVVQRYVDNKVLTEIYHNESSFLFRI